MPRKNIIKNKLNIVKKIQVVKLDLKQSILNSQQNANGYLAWISQTILKVYSCLIVKLNLKHSILSSYYNTNKYLPQPFQTASRAYFSLIVKLNFKRNYTTVISASMFFLSYILFVILLSSCKPTLTFWFVVKINYIFLLLSWNLKYSFLLKRQSVDNFNINNNLPSIRLQLYLYLDFSYFLQQIM